MKDATDRNRTSPFAFTGNKFEFRSVGSQDSIGEANVVLNTIVAEAFSNACDYIEAAEDKDQAVHDYIKKLATEHQNSLQWGWLCTRMGGRSCKTWSSKSEIYGGCNSCSYR